MFAYPLYKKSGTWEISTSNVSNDFYEGFGFGQVCSYGIGCGYIIKADKIIYNCTTRRDKQDGSPEQMCKALEEVLNQMRSIVDPKSGEVKTEVKADESVKEEVPAKIEEEKKPEEAEAEAEVNPYN